MKRVRLGHSDIDVSAMGLGCMGMTDSYGTPDPESSIDTIHRGLELGLNFFDTANVYALGENERLLGRALQGKRDKAVVASKFGLVRDDTGAWIGVSGKPEDCRRECDRSLARLGIDDIDLYYLHRVDPNVPIEETVGAMKELVEAGKVKTIGLSEASADTIRRAHAVHPVSAVQSEYSLWTRDLEDDVIPACAELGITFVPYSPLGRGMLTGSITSRDQFPENDYRHNTPRFQGENFEKNLAVANKVKEMAQRKGCTPAQLALSWVVTHGNKLMGRWGVVPIPGTKRRKYLEQNVAALDVNLTEEDLREIDRAFPREGVAAGTRYPSSRMGELSR